MTSDRVTSEDSGRSVARGQSVTSQRVTSEPQTDSGRSVARGQSVTSQRVTSEDTGRPVTCGQSVTSELCDVRACDVRGQCRVSGAWTVCRADAAAAVTACSIATFDAGTRVCTQFIVCLLTDSHTHAFNDVSCCVTGRQHQ